MVRVYPSQPKAARKTNFAISFYHTVQLAHLLSGSVSANPKKAAKDCIPD